MHAARPHLLEFKKEAAQRQSTFDGSATVLHGGYGDWDGAVLCVANDADYTEPALWRPCGAANLN